MGGTETQDQHHGKSREHIEIGRYLRQESPRQIAHKGSGKSGASVEVLDEDVRAVSGENIAQYTAANPGQCRHKQHENRVVSVSRRHCHLYAADREDPQSRRVRPEKHTVEKLSVREQQPPEPRDEDEDRYAERDTEEYRIPKCGGRCDAEQQITCDTAAARRGQPKHAYTKDVHAFLQSRDRPRKCESERAD